MVNKAVLSLSGGLDSTSLLIKLLSEGKEVRSYSFNYGQRHTIELEKVKKNIEFLQSKGFKVSHQVIDLTSAFSDSSSSLCFDGDIPKGDYDETNMKSTVVENRNVIFSSIIYGKALSWANKTKENVQITLGIHAGDHTIYPDTTKESQEAAAHLFKISNWGSERVEYVAPYVEFSKSQVLGEAIQAMIDMKFTMEEVDMVLSNTHSCYDPTEDGKSCGLCGTCKERLEAFAENNYKDPIPYV